MTLGGGRKNTGTRNRSTAASHTANNATVKIQGASQAGILLMPASCSLSRPDDVRPQLVHDVLKRGREGHVEVARARDVDPALDQHAARPCRHHEDPVGE